MVPPLITCLAVLLPLFRAEPISVPSQRQTRQFANIFGQRGHDVCMSTGDVAGEKRGGQCYNEAECLLTDGGNLGGVCPEQPGGNLLTGKGSCCVMTNKGACGQTSTSRISYFYNAKWPEKQSGSGTCSHKIKPMSSSIQFIRLDFETLELEVKSSNCVHDRLTVLGGKDPSGNMCGVRSKEATLVEVADDRADIEVTIQTQGPEWRWNIMITQITYAEVIAAKKKMMKKENDVANEYPCGVKNPSESNPVGKFGGNKEESNVGTRRKKPDIHLPKLSSREVFKKLEDLPVLDEFEKAQLKIYKPSFTKQVLDQSKTHIEGFGRSSLQKGRILYGNETDPNEYPWQISMWLDGNHFCGGTLVGEEWIITAAHCVDMHYRKHFERMTISLGDHDVSLHGEVPNQVRKSIKKILRFPTYDHNFIEGDLALVQLNGKVVYNDKMRPACLPEDPEDDYGWAEAIISGWGYTEITKQISEDHPRPTTSHELKEAAVYILPPDKCIMYSPFPITDRMICTYKGPYGVETTCQGDSGGPLVVNSGENKHVLVGATSFGVASCEGPYPSMFTRITAHLDFIYACMVPSLLEDL